jgi:hypothetical protein
VLTAALAAAGLSSADAAAAHGPHVSSSNHADRVTETVSGGRATAQIEERHEGHARADHALATGKGEQHDAVVSRTPLSEQDAQTHLGGDHHQGPAPGELLQATAAHVGTAQVTHVAAQGVTMPSADQMASLAATAEGANAPEAGQHGQHNEVVGKVLADALHGGGHGHNIDHLLDAAAGSHGGHGHANPALEALASHGEAAVSFGHMSFGASFHGAHGLAMMDALAVHQDAAPTHG